MSPFQGFPPNKHSNEFFEGKSWFLLLVLLTLASSAFSEKKHRRELPVPKKEQNAPNLKPQGVNEERVAPRPQASALPFSNQTAKEKNQDSLKSKAGSPGSAKCQEKHPIETFMQIASASSPQASLRGGVYFISDIREAPQVYLLESPGSWPTQITFFPDGVRYFRVSPDKLKILFAADEGGDEQYDLYLLNVKANKQTPLLVGRKKRIESVQWDSKSNWFAYTSTERNQKDLDLYRYDLGTQKSTLLTNLEGFHQVSDISLDGNLIALEAFRSVTDSDILLYDQKAKTLTNLTKDTDSYASQPLFSNNGKGLFFLSDHGTGNTQLYELTINHPTNVKALTSGRWEIENAKINRDRDVLFYSSNEDGYSKFGAFEIDKEGKRKRPASVPDIDSSVVSGFSAAESYGANGLFFTKSKSNRTSDVWLWKNGSSIQWTKSTHGPMNPDCFSSEKLIRYSSFDQTEIPAFVYLPRGVSFEEHDPIPFVVHIHGGPESQFRPSFNRTFQYFLQRGFGIFAPNIRGSTGYGRDYTLKDNYKKRMDSIQDIVEGARWLTKNQFTKSKTLSIYGGSYGGFAVLRTIEVEPKLFAAASASVGISNFVTFLQNTKAYRRQLRELEYGPLSDTEFLKSVSPIHFIEAIKTPLLIFHGANDPRVPVSETEQIVEALKKQETPVDFTIFKDEGHGNKKMSNIIVQAKQMAYFFEKYSMDETK